MNHETSMRALFSRMFGSVSSPGRIKDSLGPKNAKHFLGSRSRVHPHNQVHGFLRLQDRKKGFVYTLFAIAMVSSVMLLLSIQSEYKPGVNIADKIRSDEMSYLEKGISSDLERATYISGRRAVISVVNFEILFGNYNTTVNESIKDLMITGKYGSNTSGLMENATIANWVDTVKSLASSLGYSSEIGIGDITIGPEDAFSLNITVPAATLLYDEYLSMQLQRSGNFSAEIPIESVEDPFIVVESYGYAQQQIIKCASISGTSALGDWAYGRTYINLSENDFSGVSEKNKKILVVKTLCGKSNYAGFAAIVSENASDSPPAPHIAGVPNATNILNNALAVKQDKTLWLTNITNEAKNSCYFEAPPGPSFLDRLEGTKTLSAKYSLPGINTGIGSFIYVPGLPPEIQHGTETYAIDYEYFA